MSDQPIRVIAISGSLREPSYTRMALHIALRGAQDSGAETALIDLRDYKLPLCDGSDDVTPDVVLLRRDVASAQGIILGTPIYHGSFSGVLKNALDLMGFEEFSGRIVGLVGVAGGKTGAVTAPPAYEPVYKFPLRVEDGTIQIRDDRWK